MGLSIEILETDVQIEKLILKAIADEFNTRFLQKRAKIRDRVADVTGQFIMATSTYQALLSGELAGHFGLPATDRMGRLNTIISTIKNSIQIDYKNVKVQGTRFVNGAEIGILIKDFSDILSLSEAIVTTEKGQQLPWLEWLLKNGDRMIISEYDINFVAGKGRSGMAIMVKNTSGVWRVPPQYAGTIQNNWLTRAIKDNQQAFIDRIQQILENELQ